MRIISGLFSAALLAVIVCFALSNRTPVAVGLWPLTDTATMPLYLAALLPLAVGLLIGGLAGWLRGVPHRLRARRLNRELADLNRRLGELQKTTIIEQPLLSPKRPFWKRKI